MSTPRGFKDRADDSLFTLVGDVPELVRNLVVAEVDAGKAWVKRTGKDAGIGSVWIIAALFFLFWAIAALLAFAVIGFASWMPLWGAALLVFGIIIVTTILLALIGVMRFRRITKTTNPAQSIATDVKEIRNEF
ncbi:phage holin family protein [Microbacterium sp. RU33B]|uniref:phage holin family protein n=1 Tax=Microbacterium sp. RU33B TaxID=1907390 RepID=UPI000978369E|nr:phage holin family protein [Microbacterium sp. RU33B]